MVVQNSGGQLLVGNKFSITDILRRHHAGENEHGGDEVGLANPKLTEYWEMLEVKESFKAAQPYMFELA